MSALRRRLRRNSLLAAACFVAGAAVLVLASRAEACDPARPDPATPVAPASAGPAPAREAPRALVHADAHNPVCESIRHRLAEGDGDDARDWFERGQQADCW